jgi:hypothetical protein
MEDFFSEQAVQSLRDSGALRVENDYRASFVYPLSSNACINATNPNPSQACYRPPHLLLATEPENAAVIGKIIEHEYGHRAHHAKGGWPGDEVGCNFCENVAEFIRVAKELSSPILTRGQDHPCWPWYSQIEGVRNDPDGDLGCWERDYLRWSPGLYDLFDNNEDDIDDNPSYICSGDLCSDISEWSRLPFRNMWDVFANVILDNDPNDPATAGQRWTTIYVNANGLRPMPHPDYPCHRQDVWQDMKRTSVFHGVYSCEITFPQAP